ncbi:uncharacterized protein LOC132704261 [Cylas formicarius]|uniref:uncharacterized protein LOC132704261 n=1 Tax=Cylas formicarius TaxID=197179 RepID=UPI0029584176|nr:uncharacterized protein LOC132704261 [Cylas formicarius]
MSTNPMRNVLVNGNKLFRTFNAARGLSVSPNESGTKILKSPRRDVEIPKQTIPEYVFQRMEQFSKYIAFECSITKRNYTFGEVRTKCRNLSKALRKKLKLQKRDTVALYIPNIPEFPIATLGCLEAGLVVTTINALYTPDEISRQLKDSSTKAVITIPEMYENVTVAIEKLQKKLPIICINTQSGQSLPQGAINFNEFANNVIDIPDFENAEASDLAFLPYSSGTTGLPKGVELSHSNIVSNLAQFNVPEINFMEQTTDSFQEVTPAVLPMFHIYGFTVTTLNMLVNGVKVITLPKFTPELYVDVLRNNDVSMLFVAPPLLLFLSENPSVKEEYFRSLKVVLCGAAPLGALDEERFIHKAKKNVYLLQGYGLTETSPVIAMTTRDIKEKLREKTEGSIGVPLPNTQIKIANVNDLSGKPLGPNESGELLVKGPQVMRCYHNNPKATEEIFLDGWLRTGDLAHYDDFGLLFITDRVKELIKVKGFQVAPAELEEVIRDFPTVGDAAVIGIPHKEHGEVPRAYVVPRTKDDNINLEELNSFVNEKVAKYKQLRGGVQIVSEIPKNAAGKILRRQLKLKFQSENIK